MLTPERERQIPYITYVWNLKYDTNEPIYKSERLRVPEEEKKEKLKSLQRNDG